MNHTIRIDITGFVRKFFQNDKTKNSSSHSAYVCNADRIFLKQLAKSLSNSSHHYRLKKVLSFSIRYLWPFVGTSDTLAASVS